MKFRTILTAGLLCLVSGSVLANRVDISNVSPDHKPITIQYQYARQLNSGEVKLSSPQTLQVSGRASVGFDGHAGELAGVVIMSMNGHEIPSENRQFGAPMTCSLATDLAHPQGELKISYEQTGKNHGTMTCASFGGVSGQ